MMCDVMEFLIRKCDDHEWPALPLRRMSQVLAPSGWTHTQQ